jgi:hypothetical protein
MCKHWVAFNIWEVTAVKVISQTRHLITKHLERKDLAALVPVLHFGFRIAYSRRFGCMRHNSARAQPQRASSDQAAGTFRSGDTQTSVTTTLHLQLFRPKPETYIVNHCHHVRLRLLSDASERPGTYTPP